MPAHKLRRGRGRVGLNAKLDASDVFSTYLYTGNGSTQTINNGIDLAGKGGMVWRKTRTGTTTFGENMINDTLRGTNNVIRTSATGAQSVANNTLTAFNSNGFSIGISSDGNNLNDTYASWTFRKAPKFFDIVTYTGNGTTQTISHNLGIEPGMIIIKSINSASSWAVYHRSVGNNNALILNGTNSITDFVGAEWWNNTTPTTSSFTVGGNASVNNSGGVQYVAYLFAHDPSADGIIQCGSFTTDSGGYANVALGWEPQYILVKSVSSGHWIVLDVMRGFCNTSIAQLFPNLTNAESIANAEYYAKPTSTGFAIGSFVTNDTYIYMAIRRPNKVPTSGTEVFGMSTADGSTLPTYKSSFPVDMAFSRAKSTANNWLNYSRLAGSSYLLLNTLDAEASNSLFKSDYMNGIRNSTTVDINDYAWMFKRAKGFFDVVCYTGNAAYGRAITHNLGVPPELVIVKNRSNSYDWWVYHSGIGATNYVRLNTANALSTYAVWADTAPSLSSFYVSNDLFVNGNANNYVAYLFASCPGVSKVGSYTGNGTSQTIDCGFSTGARFVLIKCTSAAGHWRVYDSVRGITAGNDPELFLNLTNAEQTVYDCIDPHASGFIVNSDGANINVTSATYIYLAIS